MQNFVEFSSHEFDKKLQVLVMKLNHVQNLLPRTPIAGPSYD